MKPLDIFMDFFVQKFCI